MAQKLNQKRKEDLYLRPAVSNSSDQQTITLRNKSTTMGGFGKIGMRSPSARLFTAPAKSGIHDEDHLLLMLPALPLF